MWYFSCTAKCTAVRGRLSTELCMPEDLFLVSNRNRGGTEIVEGAVLVSSVQIRKHDALDVYCIIRVLARLASNVLIGWPTIRTYAS